MSTLSPEQSQLQRLVTRFDSLAKTVNERLAPQPVPSKEIDTRLSASVVFQALDMRKKAVSVINGSEDIYVDRVSFAAEVASSDSQHVITPTSLADSPGGLYVPYAGIPMFDFFWNYVLGSTGEAYATSANDVDFLSRISLGNRERNRPLPLMLPLRIKGGDTVKFTLKPAYYGTASGASVYSVVLSMTMHGRRTGRMAESAYNAGFRRNLRRPA